MSKQEFTAIIFFKQGHQFPAMKYRKVTNMQGFMKFATNKYHDNISSVNFYDRKTREFIKQLKPNL